MKVGLYKASPLRGAVPELELEARLEVPGLDLASAPGFYEGEAAKLLDALVASLPGGTIDALLVALLERKRSMLRVPDVATPPAGDVAAPVQCPRVACSGLTYPYGETGKVRMCSTCRGAFRG